MQIEVGPGQKNEIEEPLSHLLLQVRCEDSCSLTIRTNVQLKTLVAIAVLKPELEIVRPVLKHFRTIRSSGLGVSSQQKGQHGTRLNWTNSISPDTLPQQTTFQVQSGTKAAPSS